MSVERQSYGSSMSDLKIHTARNPGKILYMWHKIIFREIGVRAVWRRRV